MATGIPVTSNVTNLRCRECGTETDIGPIHVCDVCFGPLEVAYDEDLIVQRVSRERIAGGPATMWRYADLLPLIDDDPAVRVDLGTGFTPLRPAPRLAARLGLGELYLKDDTRNPSGSFKDRVVTVALTAARALGIETVGCASTGNLANAVAAHAAATGLTAYVFVPHDLEQAKIVASAVYGANVVSVKGTYDEVNRLCAEVADHKSWGLCNVNLRPYYAEGSKTIGFEIAEQLGWRLPDHVVIPVASGAMLTKVHKAFGELQRYGLVDGATPRISGAQAAGCNPVAAAFKAGTRDIRPVKPDTIARSLAIGDPADGYYAVGIAQETGGVVEDVTDDEIVAGIRLLAETEGIFAETAGGVTVANLLKLARAGVVRRDERVVAVISGNGFKTIEALAPSTGATYHVAPSLDDLLAQLESRQEQP
ncbi:MAG: threonine synthase [Actinobacteria bacterium]|nr:threonine synthase [Actinomycetota bacterium]